MVQSKSALFSTLLLAGQASATLQPIVMKGSKFFYENGTQFFMKGVAYQQNSAAAGTSTGSSTYADPLADETSCKRDVPLLQELGTNTIRTYAIDPTKDHDACMALLDAAGIYVISDLSSPSESINRDDPKWNVDLYTRYTAVIDALGKYSNVIGFFAGNEVTNNATNTPASAFVKAAVRDSKAYIKANKSRWMGVGYAANDDADIRADISHYFNCGDQDQAVDYWGYNIYEWCGESTFEKSGYSTQVDFFKNYSVPVFFAEYGCNNQGAKNRIFQETDAIYSDQMTGVMSGGIVYMYFQEDNDYGLVDVRSGSAVKLDDFDTLKARVLAAKPNAVQEDTYTPSNSPATCPALGKTWQANGDALPPKPDSTLCDCMYKSLSCAPKDSTSEEDYGSIFGYICSNKPAACNGIKSNTSTGVYGAYSMCNPKAQLGYVASQYYKELNNDQTACDFKGALQLVDGSISSECSAGLQAAEAANAIAATATAGTAGQTGVTSSNSSSTNDNAAPSAGSVAMGVYLALAMAVGGLMVAL